MKTQYKHITYVASRDYYAVRYKGITKITRTLEDAVKILQDMTGLSHYSPEYALKILERRDSFPDKPLGEALDDWYKTVKRPRISWQTRKRYDIAVWRVIKPMLGILPLKEVTNAKVSLFIHNISQHGYIGGVKQGMAVSSIRIVATILSQFFNAMEREGVIEGNPCKFLLLPREERNQRRALSNDEVDNVLLYMQNNYSKAKYWMYRCYFETGCRRGELAGLTWEYVHLQEGYFNVQKVMAWNPDEKKWMLKDTPKTISSKRSIPISDEVKQYLCDLFLERKPKMSDYVFLNRQGNPFNPKHISQDFRIAVLRCGIDIRDVSLHTTRHTFATRLVENGVDLTTAMSLGGWAKASTMLNIYTHATKNLSRERDVIQTVFGQTKNCNKKMLQHVADGNFLKKSEEKL